MTKEDTYIYDGDFKHGKKSGNGFLNLKNGYEYIGEFFKDFFIKGTLSIWNNVADEGSFCYTINLNLNFDNTLKL
jgi:hypothetical protein